ncbi:MAG: hypothetical protein Tsb008_04760 [Rhodothalassiaceae bacterium]
MAGPISRDTLLLAALARESGRRLPHGRGVSSSPQPQTPGALGLRTDEAMTARQIPESPSPTASRFGREAPLRGRERPPPPGSLLDIRV